jgi:hypothetical protein
MRDDLIFIDRQDRFAETPDAALIDRASAGAARFEDVAIGKRVALDVEEIAAFARVADLERVELPSARDALQPFAHTARTPCLAIGETRAIERTCSNAVCIAAVTRCAMSSFAQIATSVGPEPLIVQANAPASSAARFTALKCGMSAVRRGSA